MAGLPQAARLGGASNLGLRLEPDEALTLDRGEIRWWQGALLGAIIFASALPYVGRLGFNSDDWGFLATLATAADQSFLGLWAAQWQTRQHAGPTDAGVDPGPSVPVVRREAVGLPRRQCVAPGRARDAAVARPASGGARATGQQGKQVPAFELRRHLRGPILFSAQLGDGPHVVTDLAWRLAVQTVMEVGRCQRPLRRLWECARTGHLSCLTGLDSLAACARPGRFCSSMGPLVGLVEVAGVRTGPRRSKPKEALAALKDVREVRLLLEEAELGAVKAARHAGYSWAEIAVALGVTKQAAWERWHEFDVPACDASAS